MNKEVKTKWLKALRSKKYTQTSGALKEGGNDFGFSHCCLGVLCELHNEDNPKYKWGERYSGAAEMGYGKLKTRHGMPTQAVNKWAGLKTKQGKTLADMNDNGSTFRQIANYISKEY